MNFYKIFIIVGLFSSLTFNVLGSNAKEMLFTSPIIYKPIIDLALSKNTKPLNKRQPIKIPEFKTTIIISNFIPDKEDKEQFDSFVQISFKEIENIKILVFKKDNFVQQLYVIRKEGASETVLKYKRNIDSLLSKVSKENKVYFNTTKKTFLSILKKEDFLTDLSEGTHVLTFKRFEALTDVIMGDVYFSELPYFHGFCFRKYYINSALVNIKTRGIVFAVTFLKNYISIANLFDEKILNGFECYFYPNQGLKYLTDLRNGKQMDVTTWSPNGENEKKMSFNDWAKMIRVIKK